MMEKQIVIRPMKEKDLQMLSEVYVRAYRVYSQWEHWSNEKAYKLFEYWLEKQPDLAFVAECDGKVVGAFVAGIKPWWDGNHLADGELVVDPDYQKRGIGTLLLETMFENAAKKYNATLWETVTFKKTEFPLIWYKRLGFNEIKEWTMMNGNIEETLKRLKEKPRSL